MGTERGLGPFESASGLDFRVPVPAMLPVRARPRAPELGDVAAATRNSLDGTRDRVMPGMSVAVTAGSRGIHDNALVLRTCLDWLKENGARPFVVPAMGSHGGATAAGQLELLASLGITEATMGAPIRATMDTVVVDRLPDGPELHVDAFAWAGDAILPHCQLGN